MISYNMLDLKESYSMTFASQDENISRISDSFKRTPLHVAASEGQVYFKLVRVVTHFLPIYNLIFQILNLQE